MRRHGFTLVELVVVILILGILAGVATGRFLEASEDARKHTLRTSVDTMASVVEIRTAYDGGQIPADLPARWFSGGRHPMNPYNSFGVADLQVVDQPGVEHPPDATLASGSAGAFWYNAANGIVRARVPLQGSRAQTVALYADVNRVAPSDALEEAVSAGS